MVYGLRKAPAASWSLCAFEEHSGAPAYASSQPTTDGRVRSPNGAERRPTNMSVSHPRAPIAPQEMWLPRGTRRMTRPKRLASASDRAGRSWRVQSC